MSVVIICCLTTGMIKLLLILLRSRIIIGALDIAPEQDYHLADAEHYKPGKA